MDIDALIAKYLSGEITPEENDIINKWRALSPDNESIFRQSEEAWSLIQISHYHYNKERIWTGIQKGISRHYSLRSLLRVACVAASVALVSGWALNRIFTTDDHPNLISEQPQIITLYVPAGVSLKTILPDSTVVWLNSSSILSYPSYFDGNTRTIELIGEAFFDVAPDETKPFIINSENLKVNVLGTSFNFKHYADDTHTILAVETGTVTLSIGASANITLQAGKYAAVENHTLKTKILKSPQAGMATWRDNKMIFRDEPVSNILNELSRKYNVEFEIQGETIKHYIYTATFDNMSLEDVLKLLKMSSPIDYFIQSQTINSLNAYGKRKIIIFQK